jgi:hypothetical protein
MPHRSCRQEQQRRGSEVAHGLLDRFRKREPTNHQRERLARITNRQQREALLLAIQRGVEIPLRGTVTGELRCRPDLRQGSRALVGSELASLIDNLYNFASKHYETRSEFLEDPPEGLKSALGQVRRHSDSGRDRGDA